MKKYFITLAAVAVCAVAMFVGCEKDYGELVTREYPIDGEYTSLDISDAFHVSVSDDVTVARVTVGERLHDRVEVYVKNGVLHLGLKRHLWSGGSAATVVIPAKTDLDNLVLSGASTYKGDMNSPCKSTIIKLSGASDYMGLVISDMITLDLSGASTATLSGTCNCNMDMVLSGASDVYACDLAAQSVTGVMSGASNADVTCCSSLKVELSGASKLTYGAVSDDCRLVVRCETSGSSEVLPRRHRM